MATIPVLIELEPSPSVVDALSVSAAFGVTGEPDAPTTTPALDAAQESVDVALDPEFPPVALPRLEARERREDDVYDTGMLLQVAAESELTSVVVRASVDEDQVEELRRRSAVIQVYSDPRIEPLLVCPGNPPVGTDADVERLLCRSDLRGAGLDGTGVLVAIVDTGVNLAHLNARGKNPTFDAARSWVPRTGLVPGSMPVDHGTMCAYDVCIAAPNCTLLDVALLASTATGPNIMAGFLSDAVRAYRHLVDLMSAPRLPGEMRSLVVNNSWGMYHPSWDFPPGDPGNYSDNPGHPFNRIVAELELAGADILFAAGNCGADCPDRRCRGVTANAIYGANSHPQVLCVAGVDTTKTRVGYSTIGPGRLTANKPDIAGYTHFRGSGVYAADGGTSAACPVVAGVVAAVRSKRPYNASDSTTHPAAVRSLITSTAEDLGTAGYDYQHGYGVVDGCALARRLTPTIKIDLRHRYPWLREPLFPIDICRRFPRLCERSPFHRIPRREPMPGFRPRIGPRLGLEDVGGDPEAEGGQLAAAAAYADELGLADESGEFDPIELSYVLGWLHATSGEQAPSAPSEPSGGGSPPRKSGGCGCGGG